MTKYVIQLTLLIFLLSSFISCKKEDKVDHGKKETHEKKTETGHSKEEKAGHKIHWTYKGKNGTENWGKLDKKFAECKNGKKQSPIDISNFKEATNLKDLKFDYKVTDLKIVNNGHTIKVSQDAGSTFTSGDKKYDLLQLHFHSPSEHTIKGKSYPLEMHLVHKSKEGKLAVVSVMFKKGKDNSFLKSIWEYMPSEVNKPMSHSKKIDPTLGLPKSLSYYNYTGSLTTPPCSEEVNWHVLVSDELTVSEEQIKKFSALISANNRPIQPLNERKVLMKK